MKYKSKNGTLPTSLVIYRDGVGEGQISQVHKTEVHLLKVIINIIIHFVNSFWNYSNYHYILILDGL